MTGFSSTTATTSASWAMTAAAAAGSSFSRKRLAKVMRSRVASAATAGRWPGKTIGAVSTSRATATPAAVSASARRFRTAATTAIGNAGRSTSGVRLWSAGSGPRDPSPSAWVMASAPIAATASHASSQASRAATSPRAVTNRAGRWARCRRPRRPRRRGPARATPSSGRCGPARPGPGRRLRALAAVGRVREVLVRAEPHGGPVDARVAVVHPERLEPDVEDGPLRADGDDGAEDAQGEGERLALVVVLEGGVLGVHRARSCRPGPR